MKKKCDAEEIRKLKEENISLKNKIKDLKSSIQTSATASGLKKENEELVKHLKLTTSVLKKEIDGYKSALQVSFRSSFFYSIFIQPEIFSTMGQL